MSGFGSVGLFGAGGAWFGTPVLGRRWRNGLTALRRWLWFRQFAVLQLLAGRPAGPVLISVFEGCMPSVPDYYALPGVSPDAGGDEVRRAYRAAALRLHPDRNGGSQAAGERMRAINEAWQELRDPDRRADYDRRYWSAYGLLRRVGASAGSGTARVWVSPKVFVSPSRTEP